jgi:hypothetical protein
MNGAVAHGDELAARRLWQHVEVVHAVVYFAPEVAEGFAEAGVEGWWAGYFAGRAAPLGECSAEVVQAAFYGFAPGRVAKAVPRVWRSLSPGAAIRLREHRAGVVLDRVLGPGAWRHDLSPAVELLRVALEDAGVEGRVLYAANRSLDWPDDPLEALWHGCTLLREHRGDGHNAVLVAEGLDGAQANQLAAAAGVLTGSEAQRVNRGWSEHEWAEAAASLVERGLIDGGALTPAGRALRDEIEHRTDRAAAGPAVALGPQGRETLEQLLAPVLSAVVGSGTVGYPNPIGLTEPGPATR